MKFQLSKSLVDLNINQFLNSAHETIKLQKHCLKSICYYLQIPFFIINGSLNGSAIATFFLNSSLRNERFYFEIKQQMCSIKSTL